MASVFGGAARRPFVAIAMFVIGTETPVCRNAPIEAGLRSVQCDVAVIKTRFDDGPRACSVKRDVVEKSRYPNEKRKSDDEVERHAAEEAG